MSLFGRCTECRRVIWPWNHFAFLVTGVRRVEYHTTCFRAIGRRPA